MNSRFPLWLSLIAAIGCHADPLQVILIRHGEKPEGKKDPHLTAAGRDRARHWSEVLGTCDPLPQILLAPEPSAEHPSVRPRETLQPLADQLTLKIETPVRSDAHGLLAKSVRTETRFAGKAVVICWVHQSLPQLARELGATNAPSEWSAEDYGTAWILKYATNGSCTFTPWIEKTPSK